MCGFTNKEEFLLKEYDNASKLTFHNDELISKITIYYLTIAGFSATGLTIISKEVPSSIVLPQLHFLFMALLFVIYLVGLFLSMLISRLRKVQLEHFRIINNIRELYLQQDETLWNVLELSKYTLPTPNRRSGVYFWYFTIALLNSYYLAFFFYSLFTSINTKYEITIVCFLFMFFYNIIFHDRIYFYFADQYRRRTYIIDADNNLSLSDK